MLPMGLNLHEACRRERWAARPREWRVRTRMSPRAARSRRRRAEARSPLDGDRQAVTHGQQRGNELLGFTQVVDDLAGDDGACR